jgi:hypothetical protein
VADRSADRANSIHGPGRRFLNGRDLLADVFGGGLGGLRRKVLHLTGDHGEALASLACPRRFDRCIECKQVGLSNI